MVKQKTEYVYTVGIAFGRGEPKEGSCRVEERDGNRLKVLLPGRKRSQWISASHVQEVPKQVRLYKKSDFDQDCGCTAVADVSTSRLVVYNIYGSYKKYGKSKTSDGSTASPHHRRKQLKEQGFTRAKGRNKTIKSANKEIYRFLKKGYRVSQTVAR